MDAALDSLVNGLSYAAIAVSFYLIYRATRGIDFVVAPVASVSAYSVSCLPVPGSVAVLAAAVAGALAALVLFEAVQRHAIQGTRASGWLFATGLGLLMGIDSTLGLVFGGGPRALQRIDGYDSPLGLGVSLSQGRTFMAATLLVATLALAVFVEHTAVGCRIRALADSPSLGRIHIGESRSYHRIAYALAGALTAVSVFLVCVDSDLRPGVEMLTILGGLVGFLGGSTRSAWRAALGGLAWGVVEYHLGRVASLSVSAALGLTATMVLIGVRGQPRGLLDWGAAERPS